MTNRLAQAQSLYLRKHAENPIEWWTWCDEALETARRNDKPIFLSVGYSSCHWCTVMEGEAFSDPTIAEYMNANFLPIKVDREERPDLDSIYMQALQMMVGQGGWPLNIFLAPDDLVPFYGGTYFPVDPRYGRPGFLQVLQAIRHYYDSEKGKLDGIKAEILNNLQNSVALQPASDLGAGLLKEGLESSAGVLSSKAPGPSFPMIPYSEAALRMVRFNGESRYDARELTTQRGLDLALGGIFDHVGGGFHRYTVDPTWTVPHFEKMLYDNGQIVEYLANLWGMGVEEPAFERSISLTVQWLKREMTAPQGYFYAAQDADSFTTSDEAEPEEGAFYVWSFDELQTALSVEELTELSGQFTVTEKGNFERLNVLQRRHSGKLSDCVEGAIAKLFLLRYGASADELTTFPPARNNQEAKTTAWSGRIPAVTDTKMIVAWNSLMISGLARSYAVFRELEYLELASQAADFILQNQWIDGRFHRVNYEGNVEVLAQSEDYALFIKALLDLHQVTRSIRPAAPENQTDWLEQAIRVQAEFDEFLWSIEMGGYYNTAKDASRDLLVRERSYVDNATPAANGVAIANLVRFALLTKDLDYFDKAEQTLQAFGSIMQESPTACPSLFVALDWLRNCTLVRSSADQIALLETQYLPTAVFALEANLPEGVVGLVCQALSCKDPARSLEHLRSQLKQSLVRQQ
ncbi:thioredoxin domain-containing protein [Phormidesmis priestleyi ULC007]|uniref:Thioredoxin domain-containing protein n=1 Tax=Phormidesmis priestleyi ULC007 TaxID=1920490 RepID=A0A2T1DEU4_9CYAN|nr:thioredoxin domain-containing protein [Phormidesmis priestleyi]PSB19009.1 thioredoxin domain-containing protein [Phormidesmis priestleyi ULC007]PZO53997.1 MAG: thioredoxin domain-containing protein [Phormidesmis priestleyi]